MWEGEHCMSDNEWIDYDRTKELKDGRYTIEIQLSKKLYVVYRVINGVFNDIVDHQYNQVPAYALENILRIKRLEE